MAFKLFFTDLKYFLKFTTDILKENEKSILYRKYKGFLKVSYRFILTRLNLQITFTDSADIFPKTITSLILNEKEDCFSYRKLTFSKGFNITDIVRYYNSN